MPGSIPATSQPDWLSSMTAMIVLFWSRATRDLLKSFGWGIAGTPSIRYSDEVAILAARPIASVSPTPRRDGTDPFALTVTDLHPVRLRGKGRHHRREWDGGFESASLQRRVCEPSPRSTDGRSGYLRRAIRA